MPATEFKDKIYQITDIDRENVLVWSQCVFWRWGFVKQGLNVHLYAKTVLEDAFTDSLQLSWKPSASSGITWPTMDG